MWGHLDMPSIKSSMMNAVLDALTAVASWQVSRGQRPGILEACLVMLCNPDILCQLGFGDPGDLGKA